MKTLKNEELEEASEELKKLFGEYPGAGFIFGRTNDDKWNAGVYFATGRHESSRERRLAEIEGAVWIEATGNKLLEQGSSALLYYPALKVIEKAIIIGNGVQTNLVYDQTRKINFKDLESLNNGDIRGEDLVAGHIIEASLCDDHFVLNKKFGEINETSYLPDKPNTSRITGCAVGDYVATAVISKDGAGKTYRDFKNLKLTSGKGYLVQSYVENQDSPPSFEGLPPEVDFPWENPKETAEEIYAALDIIVEKQNIRVGVAAVFQNLETGDVRIFKVNRHDLETMV